MVELDLFAPPSVASEGAWSVSEITNRARLLIEAGFDRIWVQGEVTGFKKYRSGHWYFTLRDKRAQVRCAMFRSDNRRLPAPPEEGMQVFVDARPTVWEERGDFRLTVKRLIPTDQGGLWALQLERARAALERDGLLDPGRKRALPQFPERIVIVSSTDGAALRDVVTVVRRRWPVTGLLVVPTRVQGEGADREICRALELAYRIPQSDLIMLARGGGSREDLWVFNVETVARTLAASPVPTVSAVGHETDVTLTDLVADLRAATPSVGAESVVPDLVDVRRWLNGLGGRMAKSLTGKARLGGERLERTGDRISTAMQRQLERRAAVLGRFGASLNALSPLKTLARGYAVPRDREGRLLKSVADFTREMPFDLTVSDGKVGARVEKSDG